MNDLDIKKDKCSEDTFKHKYKSWLIKECKTMLKQIKKGRKLSTMVDIRKSSYNREVIMLAIWW